MIYPKFQEFKNLNLDYATVSLLKEIDGDTETPITLFQKLSGQGKAFLLESVEEGHQRGRYSYIGRDPFITISCLGEDISLSKDGQLYQKSGQPLNFVDSILKKYQLPKNNRLPDFSAGAVGYIGYDVAKSYAKIETEKEDDIQVPDIFLLLCREIIAYDHVKQKISIILNQFEENRDYTSYMKACTRIQEIEEEILSRPPAREDQPRKAETVLNYRSSETSDSFQEKVVKIKKYIEEGSVSQVVLSQRLELDTSLRAFDVYRNLRALNPSPYLFYIDFKDFQILGSSPEALVKQKGQQLFTSPLAGTCPRGQSEEEDDLLIEALLKDKKELREHQLLLELAREDLERLCDKEDIKTGEYMTTCKYSHVIHISSNLSGRRKAHKGFPDILSTFLPAGTLSGYPRQEAMRIIDQEEKYKRGFYGGAVGYLGLDGNIDTCIAIRSILFKDKKAYLQAGAGIVKDSNPEKEYLETHMKLAALMETLEITNRKSKESICF